MNALRIVTSVSSMSSEESRELISSARVRDLANHNWHLAGHQQALPTPATNFIHNFPVVEEILTFDPFKLLIL